MVAIRLHRVPREDSCNSVPVGDPLVEAQLRDVAVLAMIALLFVLTLQVLWLTGDRRRRDQDR